MNEKRRYSDGLRRGPATSPPQPPEGVELLMVDLHLARLRRERDRARREADAAHELLLDFGDRAIEYFRQQVRKHDRAASPGGRFRAPAGLIEGFRRCEREPFWARAYAELEREESGRPREDVRILAYIRCGLIGSDGSGSSPPPPCFRARRLLLLREREGAPHGGGGGGGGGEAVATAVDGRAEAGPATDAEADGGGDE